MIHPDIAERVIVFDILRFSGKSFSVDSGCTSSTKISISKVSFAEVNGS